MIFLRVHFLACIMYFFVNDITMLLIVRFVHGIGFGVASNTIVTIASSILPKKRFGDAFGYFMLATTLAVGLGPYISGFFYDMWGAEGRFLLASVFSTAALISIHLLDLSGFSLGGDVFDDGSILSKLFEPCAVPASLFTALTALGYVSILSFYRLYAVEVNLTDAFSVFFLIYSAVLFASRPLAGKIQDRYGDRIICIFGIAVQSIGLFVIASRPDTVSVWVCAVSLALGFGTLNSVCGSIVSRDVAENRRPYAISTFFVFCDEAVGFGPALLGCFVSQSGGYAPIYYISSLITLAALPVCLYALKK